MRAAIGSTAVPAGVSERACNVASMAGRAMRIGAPGRLLWRES
jgi:hypothetical protein